MFSKNSFQTHVYVVFWTTTILMVLMSSCDSTPTSVLLPEPTPDLASLKSQATPLCEKAFNTEISTIPTDVIKITGPILTSIDSDGNRWQVESDKQISFHSSLIAADVKTLACVKQYIVEVGTYTNGKPAYKTTWDIRLIQWADGKVLGGEKFDRNPPSFVYNQFSGSGGVPIEEFQTWIFGLLGDTSILKQDNAVDDIAFTPDGKILASGEGLSVNLWEITPSKTDKYKTINIGVDTSTYFGGMDFSPDGKILATATNDVIDLWDSSTWQRVGAIFTYEWAYAMDFTPDGKSIAVAGMRLGPGSSIKIFDVPTGNEQRILSDDKFEYIEFSPDGRILASYNEKGIILWNVKTGTQEWRHAQEYFFGGNERLLAFSSDGTLLASVNQNNQQVELREVGKNKVIRKFNNRIPSPHVTIVIFSPDSKIIALAYDYIYGQDNKSSSFNVIELWDVGTGQIIRTLVGHQYRVLGLAFSPDGKILASGGQDGVIKLWNLATGK